MFKKLVILMAAFGVMTACNDRNNKSGDTAKVEQAGKGDSQESKSNDDVKQEDDTEVSAADAQLQSVIYSTDWCKFNRESGQTTVFNLDENTKETGEFKIQTFDETRADYPVLTQTASAKIISIEDGMISFKYTVKEDGGTLTTQKHMFTKVFSDEIGKTINLSDSKFDIVTSGETFHGGDRCNVDMVLLHGGTWN